MRWYVIAGLAVVCLLLVAANGYQWQRGRTRDAECAARAAAYEGALAQAEVARLQAVQAAGVLNERSLPRHRQGQEQGVEPRVVEALADVPAGRDEQPFFASRNGG